MRIVLLGENGQLGQDILRYHSACSSNYSLLSLTRADLNLSHQESVKSTLSALDFDVLINCCAYTDVELAEVEQEKAFLLNAKVTELLAEVCKQKKSRLIHISTDYVFDGVTDRPYTEIDKANPLNIYGRSKLNGEKLAVQMHDDVVILRTASLFGVGGNRGLGCNFLYAILKKAKETGSLSVVSDQVMSPTWTYDLAKTIFNIIEHNVPSGIYNATNEGSTSWFELARYALNYLQISASVAPVLLSEFKSKVNRPLYSELDCQLIQSHIKPMPHWTESVEKFLNLI